MRRPFYTLRSEANAADKLARLATRLANTPDRLLPMLTAEYLASTTGAPIDRCEYALIIAKQKLAARKNAAASTEIPAAGNAVTP